FAWSPQQQQSRDGHDPGERMASLRPKRSDRAGGSAAGEGLRPAPRTQLREPHAELGPLSVALREQLTAARFKLAEPLPPPPRARRSSSASCSSDPSSTSG